MRIKKAINNSLEEKKIINTGDCAADKIKEIMDELIDIMKGGTEGDSTT